MNNRRPYAIVNLHWLPVVAPLKYPSTRAFGTTGYRECDGPTGLFSVYVKLDEDNPGPGVEQQARLYALAASMRERLPEVGNTFIITAGATAVAECVVRERGEEDDDDE